MKKQTKSSITHHLDRECSRIVRARGCCAWCLSGDYEKLQCAHVFSRTYRNTRWDLDNLLCLCASCHFRAHKQPVEFTEFVKNYLGEYKYTKLRASHNAIKRWTLPEMIEMLNIYRNIP